MFKLNERLANDTFEVAEIANCKLLLLNDSRYPWLVLVPMQENVTELYQLSDEFNQKISKTINLIAQKISKEFKTDKINIGAIGNVVSQLHIHVLGRFKKDLAWPNPVWGHSPAVPYTPEQAQEQIAKIKKMLEI
jgi:diadenosine tetraphosphate (Ap4A) HIT family hydrolase